MATEPMKEYPADIVRGTFFEHDVPISKMFVHFRTEVGGYARPLRRNRVNKLIAEWDRQAVGVLLLSMRNDGRFATIDGHHRWEAARELGIETLDALVFIDLSLEDEARLYRKFGDYLRQTALDRYHAGIAERKPEYLAIDRIIHEVGLHVPNSLGSAENSIDAVDAVLRTATTYGPDMLRRTLALIHDAWGGEHRAYRSLIIIGTSAFMARFHTNRNYARSRLVNRMAREGLSSIERRAGAAREANLAGNATNAWGQALLGLHDFRVSEDKQLGEWPKRLISEETARQSAANIRRVVASMTPEERRANAQKAVASQTPEQRSARSARSAKTRYGYTARVVTCRYCNAEVGKPCISSVTHRTLESFHNDRKADAAEWARNKMRA